MRAWIRSARRLGAACVVACPRVGHADEPDAPTEPDDDDVIEVVITGERERADRTAGAVTTVDLTEVRRESADLGDVLARVEGVAVQRSGGLGSTARFSLAGLDDAQVRFFVDGIPIELAGYPFGLQNVPITFATRVEVHKGVVPIELGADALGGAFDLVTDTASLGTRVTASYMGGSFDTHRVSAGVRHRSGLTGLLIRADAFLDTTRNDYTVRASVATPTGQTEEATVRRFHDGYLAAGGTFEVGVVDKPWADRLTFRGFATHYRRDLQHNVFMTIPYGEASYGGLSAGANATWENTFAHGVMARVTAGYAHERTDFVDVGTCVYDWFGACVVERLVPGELGKARDQSIWDDHAFARANVSWVPHRAHRVALSTAPTFVSRVGDDALQAGSDALTAPRDMLKWVTGVEHSLFLADGAFENVAFAKSYVQQSHADEVVGDVRVDKDADRALFGGGDALRYAFTPWGVVKASYEYTVRLPEFRELFGDGVLIAENLTLLPERSHNVNFSFLVDGATTRGGRLDGGVTGFFRAARDLVVLVGRNTVFFHDNVFAARVLGVEGAIGWTSPGDYVAVSGNVTWQDVRNQSDEGTFGAFAGDRIPNRPYLFANGAIRLAKSGLATARDTLSLTWRTRFVETFARTWESLGREDSKDWTPRQVVHSVVLVYGVTAVRGTELSTSLEVQNITDADVFDFYGVQKPGRAAYARVTLVY